VNNNNNNNNDDIYRESTFHDPEKTTTKVLLIDDDQIYCNLLKKLAKKRGISLTTFDPDKDFELLPDEEFFDSIIMDYDLGALKGTDLAAYFMFTPVLLASAMYLGDSDEDWPNSISEFAAKREGLEAILKKAVKIALD